MPLFDPVDGLLMHWSCWILVLTRSGTHACFTALDRTAVLTGMEARKQPGIPCRVLLPCRLVAVWVLQTKKTWT